MLQIDDIILPPELHLIMPAHTVFYITLDEKSLVQWVHVVDGVLDVEWGGDQAEGFHAWDPVFEQVSQDEVSPQACADYVKLRFRVMDLDSFDGLLQFVEVVPHEWDRAGHLAVDTTAVDAHACVLVLDGLLRQCSDILGLASTCHPVHDQNHRLFRVILRLTQPIQRYVSTIGKKHPLPLKGDLDFGRVQFVY